MNRWVAAQSIFYHLYNQVSYMSLDQISPLTFSVGNTMKRISVIVSSIIIFHTPVQPINALGAAIAILGTFLYSQVHLHLLIWVIYLRILIKCLYGTTMPCDTYIQRHTATCLWGPEKLTMALWYEVGSLGNKVNISMTPFLAQWTPPKVSLYKSKFYLKHVY